MATKYVLNIDPKLSTEDAKKTENQLNSRFAKVAKNYGEEMRKQNEKVGSSFSANMKGVFSKLKVSWLALAGVVASVLTNPFNEVDAKLNELLSKFDNISTRAKQFGVDTGRYYGLSKIAQVSGIEQSSLDTALLRIADYLEKARTGEDPTLKNYLQEKDVIDVFYKLAQTWNQMSPTARASSMGDILGMRQANQFAELIQNTDWNAFTQELTQGKSLSELGKKIDRLADLEEEQAKNRARLEINELLGASGTINRGTIQSQMSVELARQNNILEKLRDYQTYSATEVTTLQIKNITNDIKTGVQSIVNKLGDLTGINGEEAKARAWADRLKKAGLMDEEGNIKKGLDLFPKTGERTPFIWEEGGWDAWKRSWGLTK